MKAVRTKGDSSRIITCLAFFTWGLTMLCRTAFGYYMEPLHLTATQAGAANFLTSFCVCISAVAVSRFAERRNWQLPVLVAELLVCAAAVTMLSLFRSYPMVLISKALLGVGCGPVFTLLMTMTERAGTPEQYPTNAGIVANGEAILATIMGPVLIVFLLSNLGFGWTNGVLAAFLLLLAAFWRLCGRRIHGGAPVKAAAVAPVRKVLGSRNVRLCMIGGSCSLVACWCIYVYAPTMLLEAGCYSSSTMSMIMTMMGMFMALWMLFLPYLSNKIGRKPVVLLFSLLGAAALFTLYRWAARPALVLIFILFGGCCSVISMIYMAILPVDSVPAEEAATAVSLINATGELMGASVGPLLAGLIADAAGMRYGMLFASLSMAAAAAAAVFLVKPPAS